MQCQRAHKSIYMCTEARAKAFIWGPSNFWAPGVSGSVKISFQYVFPIFHIIEVQLKLDSFAYLPY